MKYTKFFRTLAVAVILAMLVAVIPAAPALAREGLDLDPSSGEIGEYIDIEGDDYDEDEAVYIYFSDEKADVNDEIDSEVENYERVKTIYLDVDETDFDTRFRVPSQLTDGEDDVDVHGGTYYLYAAYDDDEILAVEKFTVIAGEISISPDDGPVGTKVKITGTGFSESEDIFVEYDDDEIDIESGDEDTDSDGEFITYILIPESIAGDHTLKVEDDNGSESEDTFTVEPEMTVDVTSGKAGDTVTVSGTGFGGSADVTVTFGGDEVATDDADSDGSFEISFTVPAVAPGTYDIEALDDDDNSGEATFTIAANLSISATTGNVGTEVTISGTGFKPTTAVTITYASASSVVATTTTDANGAFSATFKVPASEGGPHTITATDGTSTFTDTFTMESDAPAAPVPLLPAMGVKVEQPVKFDWDEVTDDSLPVTYTLQVATDKDFTDIELEKEGLTKTEYTMTVDEELESTKKDAPYWWRVKAIDSASNESLWSGAGSFSVGFVFAMPDWAQYLLWALGGLVLFFIGFLLGRRTGYSY